MKEAKLVFVRGFGQMKILADGPNGKGTEAFTEKLAKSVGRIIERHKGPHHVHIEEKIHTHQHHHH